MLEHEGRPDGGGLLPGQQGAQAGIGITDPIKRIFPVLPFQQRRVRPEGKQEVRLGHGAGGGRGFHIKDLQDRGVPEG